MFFFKIFAKFIGDFTNVYWSCNTYIFNQSRFFSVGVVDAIHIPGLDLVDIANAGDTPIWLVSLLTLFTVGIPFFFLFYLGLKILINNLKSIGNIAKFTLLGVWLISIIGLVIIGIRQVSEHAYDERVVEKTELNITANDTLNVKMISNGNFNNDNYRRPNNFKIAHDENGEKIIYSSDVKTYSKVNKLIL